MYNFIICEDDYSMGLTIKDIIVDYANKTNLDYNVQLIQNYFEQAVKLAEDNRNHINIYFIDIGLNRVEMNGLTLARQIRKIDFMAYIIIVTSHQDLSMKVFKYKLRALEYICKLDHDFHHQIIECIDTIVSEMGPLKYSNMPRQITLKSYNDFYTVNLDDIMYIETRPGSRMLYCVLNDETIIEFNDTLKDLMNKLDSQFFHCHRSFIVNIRYMKKLGGGNQVYTVMMKDGKVCDVSKPKWRELVNRVRT